MDILNLKQLREWNPPELPSIISDGILYKQTRMIIYGKKKSFKSMLAIHTGFRIASGTPWLGYRTTRQRVLVVQLEIPQFLFRERVMKYEQGNDLHPDNLYFWTVPYMKLDKGAGYSQLTKNLEILQPQVLIIDPLYKVISGNIEKSYDAQQFQDQMDRLIDRYNITIIIIHHEGKDIPVEGGVFDRGSESLFGSSYFLNWPDAILNIEGDQETGNVNIRFTDMRNITDVLPDIRAHLERSNLTWRLRE